MQATERPSKKHEGGGREIRSRDFEAPSPPPPPTRNRKCGGRHEGENVWPELESGSRAGSKSYILPNLRTNIERFNMVLEFRKIKCMTYGLGPGLTPSLVHRRKGFVYRHRNAANGLRRRRRRREAIFPPSPFSLR